MSRLKLSVSIWLPMICFAVCLCAQQAPPAGSSAVVPPVVKFSGVLTDVNNKPVTGTVGVTFSLYQESEGGAPLWVETQNVTPDKTGHYSVMLGSASAQGLPGSAFASGEARWLGVQAQGQTEQPRTLLMSVPYALKALDAETVGGLPPSAFVKAAAPGVASAANSNAPAAAITGTGTANHITKWLSATKLGNSNIFDGASGKVGIATTSPGATLDVNGSAIVRDNATVSGNLTATGVVTGSSYQIGSNLFAFGSFSNFNAFLGFGGNTATTGTGNTANGVAALQTNTTGSNNTASGAYALDGNSGSNNTVIGFQAIHVVWVLFKESGDVAWDAHGRIWFVYHQRRCPAGWRVGGAVRLAIDKLELNGAEKISVSISNGDSAVGTHLNAGIQWAVVRAAGDHWRTAKQVGVRTRRKGDLGIDRPTDVSSCGNIYVASTRPAGPLIHRDGGVLDI